MADERRQSADQEPQTPWAGLYTIGQRLRWAINALPPERGPRGGRTRGIRLFQSKMETRAKELEAAGKPRPHGVTLNSIQTYVPRSDGTPEETMPPVDFLQEAAAVLGVREPWLISGHGSPTEAAEAERLAAERRRRHEMERTIIEGFEAGLDQPFDELPSLAQAALWRLFVNLRGSLVEYVSASETSGNHKDQVSVDRELARRIGLAILATLTPFRFYLDEQWPGITMARWGDYVTASCEALYALLAYQHPADVEPIPHDWRAFLEPREEEDDA